MDSERVPREPAPTSSGSGASERSTSPAPSTPGPTSRKWGSRSSSPGWRARSAESEEQDESTGMAPDLCHVCRSVLTMDGLETGRLYPHHKNLRSLLIAHKIGCCLCSPLVTRDYSFESRSLQVLLDREEGGAPKVPEASSRPREAPFYATLGSWKGVWDRFKPNREELNSEFTETVDSQASLTELGVSAGQAGSAGHAGQCIEVCVRLNPSYGIFLADKPEDFDLQGFWMDILKTLRWSHRQVFVTAEDLSRLGIATSLPRNTGSLETWSTIGQWLHECSTQHHCLAHVDSGWYPTRLVERISEHTFRVIRSEFALPGGYITLSHQWGDNDFLKLTQDNLSTLEEGYPINKLRKTFQEALIIAGRMKVPYIWIDSLCIIQSGDNGVDWQQQCGAMSDIYSNSLLNISADWGDKENGLFFQRQHELRLLYEVQVRWKAAAVDEARQLPQTCYLVRQHKWIDNFLKSPLNRRGWVMQERILAPRVLHFTPRQVSWECTRILRSERWPTQSFNTLFLRELSEKTDMCGKERLRMERFQLHDPSKEWSNENLRDWWDDRVHQYTACGLTKQSDRLIAIAGIAKKLQPLIKDQYVVGLWAKQMPLALSWYRESGQDPSPCAQRGYYAPSFSWAAADGYVRIHSRHEMESGTGMMSLTAVISADFVKYRNTFSTSAAKNQRTTTSDEIITHDVLGLVKTPEVEIRASGMLRSCVLLPYEDDNGIGYDLCAAFSTGIGNDWVDSFDRRDKIHGTYDRTPEEGVGLDSALYYFAPIHSLSEFQDGIIENLTSGMLLRSVDASMGRFERVASADTDFDTTLLGNESDLPAWSYDETTGTHTYYIV